MLREVNRAVSTWQEAAHVLTKNDAAIAKNINELTTALNNLERRVRKIQRVSGLACLTCGIGFFMDWVSQDKIQDRLDQCEKALREKQDRVYYTDDGK